MEPNLGGGEKVARIHQASMRIVQVLLVDFVSHGMASAARGGEHRRAGTEERIEHRIAHKAEHADQALRELDGERRGVIAG